MVGGLHDNKSPNYLNLLKTGLKKTGMVLFTQAECLQDTVSDLDELTTHGSNSTILKGFSIHDACITFNFPQQIQVRAHSCICKLGVLKPLETH